MNKGVSIIVFSCDQEAIQITHNVTLEEHLALVENARLHPFNDSFSEYPVTTSYEQRRDDMSASHVDSNWEGTDE